MTISIVSMLYSVMDCGLTQYGEGGKQAHTEAHQEGSTHSQPVREVVYRIRH
jgi:hypothetical protein